MINLWLKAFEERRECDISCLAGCDEAAAVTRLGRLLDGIDAAVSCYLIAETVTDDRIIGAAVGGILDRGCRVLVIGGRQAGRWAEAAGIWCREHGTACRHRADPPRKSVKTVGILPDTGVLELVTVSGSAADIADYVTQLSTARMAVLWDDAHLGNMTADIMEQIVREI